MVQFTRNIRCLLEKLFGVRRMCKINVQLGPNVVGVVVEVAVIRAGCSLAVTGDGLHKQHMVAAGLVAADDHLTFDEDFQRVDFYGAGEKLSEKIPEKRDFIDDYGHHPAEISAVLKSVRDTTTGRIIAVHQPHRFSRLKLLFDEFWAYAPPVVRPFSNFAERHFYELNQYQYPSSRADHT